MIQYVKRWRDLAKRREDLDYETSALARDIRSEFQSGEVGDRQFIGWCEIELGLMPRQSHDLLARGTAAKIVPDEKQWRRLGGSKAIRCLIDVPDADRKTVIMEAIGSGGNVKAVLRSRGLLEPTKGYSYKTDAERLAEYVSSLPSPPKYIREIAARYVKVYALSRRVKDAA